MRKPKLRELAEAVKAVIRGPYTTRFPAEPHTPPPGFRGKPQFDAELCIGCAACAEVCPALAIRVIDTAAADAPARRLELHYDKCIFCGQCELNCTNAGGVTLSLEYDLAGLDRAAFVESVEHELVCCELCGAAIATRSHLRWLADRLGAKAYANPTLILAGDGQMRLDPAPVRPADPLIARNDQMRVACPDCRRTVVVRELWGE